MAMLGVALDPATVVVVGSAFCELVALEGNLRPSSLTLPLGHDPARWSAQIVTLPGHGARYGVDERLGDRDDAERGDM